MREAEHRCAFMYQHHTHAYSDYNSSSYQGCLISDIVQILISYTDICRLFTPKLLTTHHYVHVFLGNIPFLKHPLKRRCNSVCCVRPTALLRRKYSFNKKSCDTWKQFDTTDISCTGPASLLATISNPRVQRVVVVVVIRHQACACKRPMLRSCRLGNAEAYRTKPNTIIPDIAFLSQYRPIISDIPSRYYNLLQLNKRSTYISSYCCTD